jgi:hypothetical protein
MQYFQQDAISKLPPQQQAQTAHLYQEEEESKEDKTEEGKDVPHESDLLLLRIEQMLLPLLM